MKTANKIANDYLAQMRESLKSRELSLRGALSQLEAIPPSKIEEIVRSSLRDPFLNAQETLDTESKRKKFISENFKYIQPIEIILNESEVKEGKAKDVVHYIPMLESLKTLVEDETFQTALAQSNVDVDSPNPDSLNDIKDGNVYRNSEFFLNNPTALCLMMYSDGVEVTNPLSFGRGKHKLVMLYWQVADVPKFQRSSINRFQLGMVYKAGLSNLIFTILSK